MYRHRSTLLHLHAQVPLDDVWFTRTYLAKRRLDKAIEEVRNDGDVSSQAHFTVVFEPYQLNPDLASGDGVDKYAWYRDTKYDGSDERMRKFITVRQSCTVRSTLTTDV